MMEWEGLVLALLLITALVVQFVRALKQRKVEPTEKESDGDVNTVRYESKRIPVRKAQGPGEQPGSARRIRNALAARRSRTSHIDVDTRSMRRGIVLMTILDPCRGVNPYVFRGEVKKRG
ncbi:MAG: hypothetical protein MRJ66_13130 [Nitrospira sp.]|nr:hypothetical protein [Nitrospira sp.]MDR4467397.1 hypothetical protein [Nitrospira sp.]